MSPIPPDSSHTDSLSAALAYAARGLAVLPIEPRGKKPLSSHGSHDASKEAVDIQSWWVQFPQANVGIATGSVSGLVVIDIDQKADGTDGEEALRALAKRFGDLPRTWISRTGGGGRHLVFRLPAGLIIRNRAGIVPGIDIRGEGGYIVAPPSIHSNGRPYAFDVDHHPDEIDLAELPAPWLAHLVGGGHGDRGGPGADPSAEKFPEGKRHDALTRLAGVMRRRGFSAQAIEAALLIDNQQRCCPPLPEEEVRTIARSIVRYRPTASPLDEGIGVDQIRGGFDTVCVADIQIKPVQFLWNGRLPAGAFSILEGPPGTGKTTIALDLAARITTGRPFPGSPANGNEKPGTVIFFSAEDGIGETIRPRSAAAGADLTRLRAFGVGDRLPRIPDDVNEIETLIRKHGASLVVIDPLLALLNSQIDSYRDQSIRTALAPLAAVASRTNASIVGIRHLTKSSGGPALYRGLGSVGIVATARAALLAMPDPRQADAFVLAVNKCNLGRQPPAFRYRLVDAPVFATSRVEWLGQASYTCDDLVSGVDGEMGPSALAEAQAFLLDTLSRGPKSGGEVLRLGRASGFFEKTLRRAKGVLGIASKKVGFDGGWVWILPEGGQQ